MISNEQLKQLDTLSTELYSLKSEIIKQSQDMVKAHAAMRGIECLRVDDLAPYGERVQFEVTVVEKEPHTMYSMDGESETRYEDIHVTSYIDVPAEYLVDQNWQELARAELEREAEEKRRAKALADEKERIRREQKELEERNRQYQEYLRLKEIFDPTQAVDLREAEGFVTGVSGTEG